MKEEHKLKLLSISKYSFTDTTSLTTNELKSGDGQLTLIELVSSSEVLAYINAMLLEPVIIVSLYCGIGWKRGVWKTYKIKG